MFHRFRRCVCRAKSLSKHLVTHPLPVLHVRVSGDLGSGPLGEAELALEVLREFVAVDDLEGPSIHRDLIADVKVLDRIVSVVQWCRLLYAMTSNEGAWKEGRAVMLILTVDK